MWYIGLSQPGRTRPGHRRAVGSLVRYALWDIRTEQEGNGKVCFVYQKSMLNHQRSEQAITGSLVVDSRFSSFSESYIVWDRMRLVFYVVLRKFRKGQVGGGSFVSVSSCVVRRSVGVQCSFLYLILSFSVAFFASSSSERPLVAVAAPLRSAGHS